MAMPEGSDLAIRPFRRRTEQPHDSRSNSCARRSEGTVQGIDEIDGHKHWMLFGGAIFATFRRRTERRHDGPIGRCKTRRA